MLNSSDGKSVQIIMYRAKWRLLAILNMQQTLFIFWVHGNCTCDRTSPTHNDNTHHLDCKHKTSATSQANNTEQAVNVNTHCVHTIVCDSLLVRLIYSSQQITLQILQWFGIYCMVKARYHQWHKYWYQGIADTDTWHRYQKCTRCKSDQHTNEAILKQAAKAGRVSD